MAKTPYEKGLTFSSRLRFVRLNLGLKQLEVASRAGIPSRNYSKYETGDAFPQPAVIVRLCKALDVSSDFLLGISDNFEPISSGSDYICISESDGNRHLYNIPPDMRDRVVSMLRAGFPEIMKEE